MEATKVSTRGQVVIPKKLRQSYRWEAGQDLIAIDTGEGVLLKAKPVGKASSWDEAMGCLGHLAKGKPVATEEDMRAAVRKMAAQRYQKSLKK